MESSRKQQAVSEMQPSLIETRNNRINGYFHLKMSSVMLLRRRRISFFLLTGQKGHFKKCEHLDTLSWWVNQNSISL